MEGGISIEGCKSGVPNQGKGEGPTSYLGGKLIQEALPPSNRPLKVSQIVSDEVNMKQMFCMTFKRAAQHLHACRLLIFHILLCLSISTCTGNYKTAPSVLSKLLVSGGLWVPGDH